ncbi:MAG: D-alanyl-D-alanine carboxypeptidase family protein [Oscillospiraceae bacterium]
MKTKRFLSVFLLLTLLLTLLAVPCAAAPVGEVTPIPVMDVAAKAALLVDGDSGEVLYAKNEHQELYPASITKIMTALLVLEAIDSGKLDMQEKLTATDHAMSTLSDDGSTAGIKVGEIMTVENLLYCMLVVSANEACNILAERVAGSVDSFVVQMNAKAKALGCVNTQFINATGLHDPEHYTSAWDIYLIAKAAMTHPAFMTFCDTKDVYIPATNLSEQRHLYTTNYLLSQFRALGYVNRDAHGIKTGSTSDAGHCLVSTAKRGSRSLISVVLGAEKIIKPDGKSDVQSFSETSRLFSWGLQYFTRQTVLSGDDLLAEVPVSLSREVNYVTVHPKEDVELLLPNDLSPDMLEKTVTLKAETAKAPIAAGDILGEVTLRHGDKVYATVPLLALNDVSASKLLVMQDKLTAFFSRTLVRVLSVIFLLVVLLLVVLWMLSRRRRHRYGRKVTHSSTYKGRRR